MTPRRLAQALATLHGPDPAAMRAQLLDTLLAAVPAEGATFVSVARSFDGALHCTHPMTRGPDPAIADLLAVHGQNRVVEDALWLPHRLKRGTLNHFLRLAVGSVQPSQEVSHLKVYQVVFSGLQVNAHLRTVLVDGQAFLGYVALMRRGVGSQFSAQEQRLLDLNVKGVAAVLAAARVLQRQDLDQDAFALCRPEGTVEHLSGAMAGWLQADPRRAAGVRELVRRFDEGTTARPRVLDGVELRAVRLDGVAVRYLVTVTLARPVHYPPASTLSARQRQHAEFAAAGATMREVAAAMGITEHTAKSHLKQVYGRLGVAHRVELAEVLRDVEETGGPPPAPLP